MSAKGNSLGTFLPNTNKATVTASSHGVSGPTRGAPAGGGALTAAATAKITVPPRGVSLSSGASAGGSTLTVAAEMKATHVGGPPRTAPVGSATSAATTAAKAAIPQSAGRTNAAPVGSATSTSTAAAVNLAKPIGVGLSNGGGATSTAKVTNPPGAVGRANVASAAGGTLAAAATKATNPHGFGSAIGALVGVGTVTTATAGKVPNPGGVNNAKGEPSGSRTSTAKVVSAVATAINSRSAGQTKSSGVRGEDPFTNVGWSSGIGGRPGLPGTSAWPPAAVPPGLPQQQPAAGVGTVQRPLSNVGSKEYRTGWGQKGHVVKPSIAIQASCYEEIKRKCLQQNALWEDSEFPATDASLFYSHSPPRRLEWKRPSEICADPQLFVGGASRFDIQQGELGDCWLLAAVASLTCNKTLLQKVVPTNQSFSEDYAGIFHFQFWQYGQWVDVVVDDRLPTYNNKLVFLHSADNNEFWSALLEKAYAKLCGSYEALKGGSQAEAMEDFTGGLTERFELQKVDQNQMLKIMLKAVERGSLMGCAIDTPGGVSEQELPTGLLTGHAYSVTDVRMVDIVTPRMSGKIPLVRVRNPWGNEVEWKGAWSDKSREWNLINDAERKELGLTFTDDGEFWMSFKDFVSNFTTLELCSLDPDSMGAAVEGGQKFKWERFLEQGQWIRRVNAGGCRNYLDTFWTNPQYRVTVTDPDDQDENDMCTLIIGLMQKDRRKLRKSGADLLTIGYAIYQLKEPGKYTGQLDLNFFKYTASFAKAPAFINTREICGRHQVPPGTYVVVPSTFEPNQEANFLLRIFTEKPNDTRDCADEPTDICESPTYDSIFDPATLADPAHQQRLKEVFKKMAGDDMEIDAYELMDILNAAFKDEFKFDGFSIETCRSMVALSDTDHSGKLGFDEFIALWQDLRGWKGVFKKFDADNSGQFNSYELRLALKGAGFSVSNSTFNCLVMRFSNKEGFIEFDDFVLCAVRLKSLFATFKTRSQYGPQASFAIDEFVQLGIYC